MTDLDFEMSVAVTADTAVWGQQMCKRAGLLGLLPLGLLLCAGGVQAQTAGGAAAPAAAAPSTVTLPSPNSSMAGQQQESRKDSQDTQKKSDDADTQKVENMTREAPTEFQQMVTATTGHPLQIFGAGLFGGVPSTFAPVEDLPIAPDYVIGPGDELRLEMWGRVNLRGSYTVDRTGSITLPEVGPIHVAGIRFGQLSEFLKTEIGRMYRNFDLSVSVGHLRSIQVFVTGEARKPGNYTISSLSTLLNAIFTSGGPTAQGSLRDIQVRRQGATIVDFDLYDLLLRGDKSKDLPLQSGDIIFIPEVGPQIAVLGSVKRPAIYELRNETTVSAAIALAGGETNTAGASQVRLERVFEHTMRSLQDIDPASATTVKVADGDVVSVGSILEKFRDSVTLRGNVANPGRYAWHLGMKLSDLLPNRDALVTRNYWLRQDQQGLAGNDYASKEGALRVQATSSGQPLGGGGTAIGNAITRTDDVFGPRNDIVLSGPDIDWAYAAIERQSPIDLKATLIPFNLGKLVLDGDQTQNLELLSGDTVTIFSKSDVRVPVSQQTRFVRLQGEFVSAGMYSARPGETLRQLVARAGGLSPQAYLYGSEFSRESTRRIEKVRLDEYANTLEAEISSLTAGASARALTDRDAATAEVSAQTAREAVSRMRSTAPVGRIVFDLSPDSSGVDVVPDIELEDGDQFIVPKLPSDVGVEGQVYNPNSFLYSHEHRAKYYMQRAGGPNTESDIRHAYILRADGSVLSEQYANLSRAYVFPGDTIVVPLKVDKRATLRNVLDVATIVGQFGLALAAVYVLTK
jgi:polysaccharide export outer membrane protein